MEIWQAIILGAVQGATEFMPISSSAHLYLVPRLFGWTYQGLAFDASLHLGTLTALLIYFGRDLWRLLLAWLRSLRDRTIAGSEARLAWLIVAGSIPAGVAGLLFEDFVETTLRDVRIIAFTLIALGILLLVADLTARGKRGLECATWWDSLTVGLAQALALVPGVSRSGATLTAGLFRGLRRDAAARFSFLLGTPITAAAGLLEFVKVAREGLSPDERAAFAVGIVTSAIVGYLTIAFLIRYLRRNSTLPFVIYRIALGIFLLGWLLGGR